MAKEKKSIWVWILFFVMIGLAILVMCSCSGKEIVEERGCVHSSDYKHKACIYKVAYKDVWYSPANEPLEQAQSFVRLDGGEDGKRYSYISALEFSPDGKHLVYIAHESFFVRFVVFDGVEGKKYYEFMPRKVFFSPDSQHYAYIACPNANSNKQVVAIDGKESKEYYYIGHIYFSPDSKHYVYAARDETGGRLFMVFDGVEIKKYTAVSSPIKFSLNSKHWAYVGGDEVEEFVVIDGELRTEGCDEVGWFRFLEGSRTLNMMCVQRTFKTIKIENSLITEEESNPEKD